MNISDLRIIDIQHAIYCPCCGDEREMFYVFPQDKIGGNCKFLCAECTLYELIDNETKAKKK